MYVIKHCRILALVSAMACMAISPQHGIADPVTDSVKDLGKAVFSEVERKIIRDYYERRTGAIQNDGGARESGEKQGKKSKPGKGKGKEKLKGLPPGIAKKLERGGTLPPGIAKQRLPNDLEGRLPPVRDGYERVVVDGKAALVDIASQEIVDLIDRAVDDMKGETARLTQQSAVKTVEKSPVNRSDDNKSNESPPWWQFWKD